MMSLQEDTIKSPVFFKNYIIGVIILNIGNYNKSIIISDNQIVKYGDKLRTVDDINNSHLNLLLKSNPEVIIIGTGNKQTLPSIYIMNKLAKVGKSADFMSSEHACKTYNLLVNENRSVSCIVLL